MGQGVIHPKQKPKHEPFAGTEKADNPYQPFHKKQTRSIKLLWGRIIFPTTVVIIPTIFTIGAGTCGEVCRGDLLARYLARGGEQSERNKKNKNP